MSNSVKKPKHASSAVNFIQGFDIVPKLSCFGVAYVDENLELEYDNKEHVPGWTQTRLKPKTIFKMKQMMYDLHEEFKARIGGEWIANNLALGDKIVVPSDTIDPFKVMIVDNGPHFIEFNFEDGWGNKWQQGDVVIQGY